jgi:hypothetical protein
MALADIQISDSDLRTAVLILACIVLVLAAFYYGNRLR